MALIDVIKYEGSNNVLVWKHPKEDFNTSAQLIVHQSQEAILFKDGQASEPFKAGKHTIETENIPGIRNIVGLVTGGVSPNHYEVYYINKAYSMEVYWGTASPWTIQDPTLQIPFNMRAHGQSAVRVSDSQKLMLKLVGTMTSFTQREIQKYFGGILSNLVKDYVSNVIISEGIGYAAINTKLRQISTLVSEQITDIFSKYGLVTEEFVIESIEIIEDEYLKMIKEAQAIRAANIIKGVTEQEKMGYDVAKAQAQNPGSGGQMAGVMTGVAAGAAVAPAIGGMMRNVVSNVGNGAGTAPQHADQFSMGTVTSGQKSASNEGTTACVKCGEPISTGSRFCNHCGAEQIADVETTCPMCGERLPVGSKFCNSCGAKL